MEGLRPFRFGVNCTAGSAAEWLDNVRKAEALGFDTVIAQDHFDAQLAPMAALAAAAMVTSRVRLATVVLDNDFRHPAVVAREATTVDVLSGGRMQLGLGAGWLESDYGKTGIPFDRPAMRLDRLSEAIQICKHYFSSDAPLTFRGKHYCIQDLDPLPRPLQKPRLPIMVGGRQRKSLALAGREADIVSISLLDRRAPGAPPGPGFRQKVEWVRSAAGARFSELEVHVNASVVAISDNPRSAVEPFASRTGLSEEEALASPGALVGSVDAILDKLHSARAEFNVNYWVIHARNMDTFAPVIARL